MLRRGTSCGRESHSPFVLRASVRGHRPVLACPSRCALRRRPWAARRRPATAAGTKTRPAAKDSTAGFPSAPGSGGHAAPRLKNNPGVKLRRLPAHRLTTACAAVLAAAALAFPAASPAATDPRASRFYEDALTRYEKRDVAGAIVQLKNALQIDKNLLPVHVLLGRALLLSGDVRGAEVALQEALRLGVNRAEVVVPLARAVIGQGRPQELLSNDRFALAGLPLPTQYELQILRASAAVDAGDLRAALKSVEDARAIDASDPSSWIAEVPIRVRSRQLAEARAAADRAVALAPNSADAHHARGETLQISGRLPEALASFDKALALQKAHLESAVARVGLLIDLRRDAEATREVQELRRLAPQEPRAQYLAAVLAERAGRADEARSALGSVTALLDPVPIEFLRFRPQLLMLGGMAHHGLNQPEKAKPYLEAVLRGQPQHPVAKVLATIYLGEKNLDRGIEALESYLRGTPNDARAMLMLASAHMSLGRHARATQILQDALKLGDQPELRSALGLSLVGRGLYADGLKELEAALAKDPGQLQAGLALVTLHLRNEQPAQAVKVAEALAQRHAGNAALQHLLGEARRRAGNAAGARTAFDAALKLDPGFAAAVVGLARLEIDAGAHDAAIARLQPLTTKEAKNVEALLASAVAFERAGQHERAQRSLEAADDVSGPNNLEPAIALVDFHLRRGQAEAAREAVKRAANKNPESLQTLIAQARVSIALRDPAAARTSLTRASNGASTNPPLLTRIALLQLDAGHVAGAVYSVDKALGERPDYLPALALKGDLALRGGEPAKAEQIARQLVAKQPRMGIGHALLGDVALAQRRPDAAVEAYRRAHELDRSSDSLLRLFRASFGRDPEGAIRLAEQWLKARPRDALVLRGLADAQLDRGQFAAARTHYEALSRLMPRDADVLNNLAFALVTLKDRAALPTAERALALAPQAPHVIGTAGWAAFQAGQPDRAVQLLRDARLRDPANPDTRYFLGAVLASTGRQQEAREELSHAVKTPGAFVHRRQAQELLASLR